MVPCFNKALQQEAALSKTQQLETKTFLFRTLVSEPVKSLSPIRLFATLWTVAYQSPPSMGFSRQEYWSALPFPSPGDLHQGSPLAAPSLPFRMVSLHIITFNLQLPVKKFNTHISGGFGFFVLSCFSVSWSFPDFFFFFWRNELYYLKYENFQDKDIFILYLLLKAYFNKLDLLHPKKKKICLPVL